jgi:addiction module HigA family antidote
MRGVAVVSESSPPVLGEASEPRTYVEPPNNGMQRTRFVTMARKRLAPVHPGEVLLHEFLQPLDLTQYRLAKSLKVPARRINEIVHGTRAVSADTALRLARYFGTSDRFWLNLQSAYDLDIQRDRLGERIKRDVPVFRKAR